MKARAAVAREAARVRNRQYIADVKASAPCTDCLTRYPPYVMQFDHLEAADKDRDLATLAGSPCSLSRLALEIAKCELVCANCHAARTWQRRSRLWAWRGTELLHRAALLSGRTKNARKRWTRDNWPLCSRVHG